MRQIKPTRVGFCAHVKIASRIVTVSLLLIDDGQSRPLHGAQQVDDDAVQLGRVRYNRHEVVRPPGASRHRPPTVRLPGHPTPRRRPVDDHPSKEALLPSGLGLA